MAIKNHKLNAKLFIGPPRHEFLEKKRWKEFIHSSQKGIEKQTIKNYQHESNESKSIGCKID